MQYIQVQELGNEGIETFIKNCRDQSQNNIQVDIWTTEKYIGLMCNFNPQLVYPFLKSVDSYRVEQMMEVKQSKFMSDPQSDTKF